MHVQPHVTPAIRVFWLGPSLNIIGANIIHSMKDYQSYHCTLEPRSYSCPDALVEGRDRLLRRDSDQDVTGCAGPLH
jgi:hypothetical protein